jgi:hypothetical protein
MADDAPVSGVTYHAGLRSVAALFANVEVWRALTPLRDGDPKNNRRMSNGN